MAKIAELETLNKTADIEVLKEIAEFWESQDSADDWRDMETVEFEVDLHKNLLHPKLTVLTHRPVHCPRCQSDFDDIHIEYMTLVDGQFLVIRDVPALRCQRQGHEYSLEKTMDEVEHLLNLQKQEKLQPKTILSVPVFSLA